MIKNNILFTQVSVFSRGDGFVLLNYMLAHALEKGVSFKEEEANFNEVNRLISAFGCDKRDSLNSSILLHIQDLVLNKVLKKIDIEKSKSKKSHYKVSGSKLEQENLKNGMYAFTPRASLDALLVVQRRDDKGKLVDAFDLLEYKGGEPVVLIAGGIGETSISDIFEISKSIGITIPGGPQLTKKEIKEREKAAAYHLQESFDDSKKIETPEDLLERIKHPKRNEKSYDPVKEKKIIDLEEAPKRIENQYNKKSK